MINYALEKSKPFTGQIWGGEVQYEKIYSPDSDKSCFVNADSLDAMQEIPDGSVDMILTDPPYGTTSNYWDTVPDIKKMFTQFDRIIKQNGAILIFCQLPFLVDLVNEYRRNFRYEIVWQKACPVGMLNANKMPLRQHENILVFYKKLPTYNPQFSKGKPYHMAPRMSGGNYHEYLFNEVKNNEKRFPTDVIKYNNINCDGRINSTQKPVKMFEYLILTYTNPHETVLDAFAGSGTTLLACRNTNRRAICFEKDKEMYEKATERLDKEIAQVNIFDMMGGSV